MNSRRFVDSSIGRVAYALDHGRQGGMLIVKARARAGGKEIGSARCFIGGAGTYARREAEEFSDTVHPVADVVGFIDSVEVLPEARGRGVGGELVRRVVEDAEDEGVEQIWLVAVPYRLSRGDDDAQVDLIRFYGKVGFKKVRTGSTAMVRG